MGEREWERKTNWIKIEIFHRNYQRKNQIFFLLLLLLLRKRIFSSLTPEYESTGTSIDFSLVHGKKSFIHWQLVLFFLSKRIEQENSGCQNGLNSLRLVNWITVGNGWSNQKIITRLIFFRNLILSGSSFHTAIKQQQKRSKSSKNNR